MSEPSVDKPELLVVDDSKVIRLAAKKMLGSEYIIHLAEDGLVGWEMLQQNTAISVVFTDLSMPNLNGMELLSNIRDSDNDNIANLPVIIMTGHDDSESMKKTVFDAGATDFIGKPFESIDLLSRAKAFARLSRKVVELERQTGHDKLTGLYNASSLQEQGAKSFSFAKRHMLAISVVYFEIEGFQDRILNYGKNVAQHIIVAIGKRLQEAMREEDVAARIGVAKYALVLPMTNKQNTVAVINRIRENISKLVFDTGKVKIRVNFVAGYSAPDLNKDVEFKDVLEQADDALLRANNSATEHVVCYDDAIESETAVVIITEQEIEQAFNHIFAGNFYQIPEQHLATVVERLLPFMQYAKNQVGSEVRDNSTERNVAV